METLPMRTRRTADDFRRDMEAKLHTTPGVAAVVTSAYRQEQRDRSAEGSHHGIGKGADIGARHGTRTEKPHRRTGGRN